MTRDIPMSPIILAAGGTGGHLFPAEALAHKLGEAGRPVVLITDARGLRYAEGFPAREIITIEAATLTGRGPVGKLVSGLKIIRAIARSRTLLRRLAPAAVVGFGGYPSFPTLAAAVSKRLPALVHEQNAILGRTNKVLARLSRAVACSFAETAAMPTRARPVHTGNPVRPEVIAARDIPYAPPDHQGPLRVLIFGGSQGAQAFADLIPGALAGLNSPLRDRLEVVQQVRLEDMARVEVAYGTSNIKAELTPFFDDLPQRIAAAHLVIARSGASTIAELGVIGRPALLIPYPAALDDQQSLNAQALAAAGGAWVFQEKDTGPADITAHISGLLSDPDRLAAAAHAARQTGLPDAVSRLARLVEEMALPRPVDGPSRAPEKGGKPPLTRLLRECAS